MQPYDRVPPNRALIWVNFTVWALKFRLMIECRMKCRRARRRLDWSSPMRYLWHRRKIRLPTNGRFYAECLRSVLLQGSETWLLRKKDIQTLTVFDYWHFLGIVGICHASLVGETESPGSQNWIDKIPNSNRLTGWDTCYEPSQINAFDIHCSPRQVMVGKCVK